MQADPTASTSAAAPAAQPAPEERALVFFARCVLDLLSIWPAVRLAITQGQGFPDSKDAFASQIVDLFFEAASSSAQGAPAPAGSTSTHENGVRLPQVDKLEETLKWSYGEEFDVDLEDASEVQVTKDLIALWRECLQRVAAGEGEGREGPMAAKFREQADKAAKEDGARPYPVQKQGGDDDSSDDEDDYTDNDGADDGDEEMVELVDASAAPAPARQEPIIDEDGFETVQPKKKGGRR
ncbi:hypothetical protein JCM6882_000937 [Rhodosporidiobolus microsporus]